ncbi:NAD synthetase [Chroococcus sp. FPU101]|nr:NAD synthetase [Chroococcus sp. FPU101]
MDNTLMDWVLGGVALVIVLSGLLMLLNGVREMGKKP